MITDPVPRDGKRRREYQKSEDLPVLAVPPSAPFQTATLRLFAALGSEEVSSVREASARILNGVSRHYGAPPPVVKVLGVRPHRVHRGVCTYQLFGDYTPQTQVIRIWMRTAVHERVSAPKAFLSTLLHELCHHLDCTALTLPSSYHTRGFFQRIDALYHQALGTPAEARKRLHWVRGRGSTYRIDWVRTRASSVAPRSGGVTAPPEGGAPRASAPDDPGPPPSR